MLCTKFWLLVSPGEQIFWTIKSRINYKLFDQIFDFWMVNISKQVLKRASLTFGLFLYGLFLIFGERSKFSAPQPVRDEIKTSSSESVKTLLITSWRSGSTIIGELLNSHPGKHTWNWKIQLFSYDSDLGWWQLLNFIVWQVKFKRFLHSNGHS